MKYISNGKLIELFITQEDMIKPLNELNKYSFYFIGEYTLRGDYIQVMYHNSRFCISNGYEIKLLSPRTQFNNLNEASEWFSMVYDNVQ